MKARTTISLILSALVSTLCFSVPAKAQTVAKKTNTTSYRAILPPCATSSVDINICDLPFIRSQCGPCSSNSPSTQPLSVSNDTFKDEETNDPNSPDYNPYLDQPTETNNVAGSFDDVAGSFDDPAPQYAGTSTGAYQKSPSIGANSNWGKVNNGFGTSTGVSPAKLPGTGVNNGPPMIPIFTCKNGYGWMPQAGAKAPIVSGGGLHGQPGAIQWTGSWNPASLQH